jgi:ABC-type branched-subunit amino acid transport system ATPase component/branched-subunit amino acid ABC-type transport system permease component
MTNFLQFAGLGLGSGAIIGLLAIGLVVIHRGSGVVNFAQGAVAMAGTYTFWTLNTNDGLNYWLAAVIGVAVAVLIGVAAQVLVMSKLRHAAPVTRLIATLGILTILEQVASDRYPTGFEVVTSKLPVTSVKIFGAVITKSSLILLGIAIVMVVALELLYRRTQFGRATMAARENQRATAAMGFSPGRLAILNWALGSALAAIAGILLAPISGLSVDTYTLLILPALAAAVVGNLASFPITLIGGLIVGVVQSELLGYVTTPGWATTSPFIIVLVFLVIRGRDRSLRSQLAERLPRLGTGKINWPLVIGVVVACIVVLEVGLSASWLDAAITSLVGAIIVLSFIPLTGYSGQLSLAQFGLAGWGAWVAGRLVASTHMTFLLALVIAVASAVPLGLALGLICLRTRGVNLAIATLGLAVALEQLIFDSAPLTGGDVGTTVGNPRLFGVDIDAISHANRYAIVCLVFLVLAGLAVANLRRGRSGRRLIAGRANDRAAGSLGVNTAGGRLFAFAFASAIAALGGVLLAFQAPSIVYTNFTSLASIQYVAQPVVGGVGFIGGAVAGGIGQIGGIVSTILGLFGQNVSNYLLLILGVLLLITVVTAPDGVAAIIGGQVRWVVSKVVPRRVPRPRPASVAIEVGEVRRVEPGSIEVDGLSVRFGGVHALEDVSIRAGSGEVVGIIGPNGAGKTTLIDALTGFAPASAGKVLLDGRDVTGQWPSTLSRHGLTRSFQSLELFDDMTVLDNLRVASEPRDLAAYLTDMVYPRTPPLAQAARAAITEFGLQDCLDQLPSELPYGRRRLVAIARAVATEPSILCLDEPAAGLDESEAHELSALLRRLVSDWGMGIVLIEHNVEIVMNVCDRIYALNFGKVIAEGTPAELRRNKDVISVYLGVSEEPGGEEAGRKDGGAAPRGEDHEPGPDAGPEPAALRAGQDSNGKAEK